MESQLKQQGAGDKLQEVLQEVPNVRRDCGYPPLVTPSSQITGSQAVLNVLMGRYKVLTGEFADLMLGYYGETIAPKNPEVLKLAEQKAKKPPITVRPADLIKPEWDELRAQALAQGANGSDEDVLTYAMFPKVASDFFKKRPEGPKNLGKDPAKAVAPAAASSAGAAAANLQHPMRYLVTLNGKEHRVTVAPGS
jgi:methylmalonyl-CoA carboxyltransferase 5S subunit